MSFWDFELCEIDEFFGFWIYGLWIEIDEFVVVVVDDDILDDLIHDDELMMKKKEIDDGCMMKQLLF
jgi:hypothetical protein